MGKGKESKKANDVTINPEKPKNPPVYWTPAEDEIIAVMYSQGMATRNIYDQFFSDRPFDSLKNRIAKLRNRDSRFDRGMSDDFLERSDEYYRKNAKIGSQKLLEALHNYFLNHHAKGKKSK